MKKNVSPAKSGLVYGVFFGVIMVLEFVIMYAIGMKSLVDSSVGLLVDISNYLVLPLIFIFLACDNYKKNINDGFILFSECLKIGVSITFIAAIIYASFSVIFNFIFPEFVDEMISTSKEAMIAKNPNMTTEQIEMGLSMVKKFMNPLIVFPFTLAMFSFIGLFCSLVIGAIVKKERP